MTVSGSGVLASWGEKGGTPGISADLLKRIQGGNLECVQKRSRARAHGRDHMRRST